MQFVATFFNHGSGRHCSKTSACCKDDFHAVLSEEMQRVQSNQQFSVSRPRQKSGLNQRSAQFFFFFGFGLGHSTARMASSKTVFKPFCVSAEHSRYLTALISLAIARPWGYVMGDSFFSLSFSTVSLSSRRSSLVPTRMMGVLGQWWPTSGNHCHTKVTWLDQTVLWKFHESSHQTCAT